MNPFILTGPIPDDLFCDRAEETKLMTKYLTSGSHLLLTSPRRMGKTQLIQHVFSQQVIKENYYTFYVDILPTTSMSELALFMGKEILGAIVPRGKKAIEYFLSFLRSLSGNIGYSIEKGGPVLELGIGDIERPELTLSEIFNYLGKAGKPCLFAIDEFQQVSEYKDARAEALLRSYIQQTPNCQFIFSGSEQHTLERMFLSYAKPFYNSAEKMTLRAIPFKTYGDFVHRHFRSSGTDVTEEALSFVYETFGGTTYYLQKMMHLAYMDAVSDQPVVTEQMKHVLDGILEENSLYYARQMAQLAQHQKQLLVAIAKEGTACGIQSGAFVKKHALPSQSAVQNAAKALLNLQLIGYDTKSHAKAYSVSDLFFSHWLRKTY